MKDRKNNRKILLIIFAVMLVGCIIKFLLYPRVMDFVGAFCILVALINSIIQRNEEIYLDKKEYKLAKKEWLNEKEENPDIKKFDKKKRLAGSDYVAYFILIFILCQPMVMLGINNYRMFNWSYEKDIEELKESSRLRYNHFPNEIPDEAWEVKWYRRSTLGNHYSYLKMQVDDKYIENLEKTFTDKDRLYEYKLLEDESSEYYDGEYGIFNHKSQGFLGVLLNGGEREEFKFVCPAKEGAVVMYITYKEYEEYDDWYAGLNVGVIINKESNTVVYFSRSDGR